MNSQRQSPARPGFTLIELLIVVAIISILAAIAVPNLLAAQVRSKVSRVRADHRSLASAIEAYRVDQNRYPHGWYHLNEQGASFTVQYENQFVRTKLRCLTTPVAYMQSLPRSAFSPNLYERAGVTFPLSEDPGSEYDTCRSEIVINSWYNNVGPLLAGSSFYNSLWHLRDAGPDNVFIDPAQDVDSMYPYDATNGTTSVGDIWRFGP